MMTKDNAELIAEARSIGNWALHETGPEGTGLAGPTLFARMVFALEAAEASRRERASKSTLGGTKLIADAAELIERERLARILYGIAGGSDRSDTWGTDNAAPDDVKHAYFDADTLMLAGFGDVEQMRAERDAALAVIAEANAAVCDIPISQQGGLWRILDKVNK